MSSLLYARTVMRNKVAILSIAFAAVITAVGFTAPQPAHAQSLWAGMEDCRAKGDCSLSDFARLAVNVSDIILGIVGSLALLMLVYGGFTWVLSGGSSEAVQKGKDIVRNAVIGLVVVFSSWMIVSLVVRAFVCSGEDANSAQCTTGTIFNRPWDSVQE